MPIEAARETPPGFSKTLLLASVVNKGIQQMGNISSFLRIASVCVALALPTAVFARQSSASNDEQGAPTTAGSI